MSASDDVKDVFIRQVKEIRKHRWIESEKAGYDVGGEWAAADWVRKYAKDFRESINSKFA